MQTGRGRLRAGDGGAAPRAALRPLVHRCEALTPKSLGGQAAEPDPEPLNRDVLRFDACFAAAQLYEDNKTKLGASTWGTLRGLADLRVRASDAGMFGTPSLSLLPRKLWPRDPKGFREGADARHQKYEDTAEFQRKQGRLVLCLEGDHKSCEDGWQENMLPDPEVPHARFAESTCIEPETSRKAGTNSWGKELFAMGVSCAHAGATHLPPIHSGSDDETTRGLQLARRGCWLDDFTCGIYAHLLEVTGGPSNEIAFEYKRACDAGNASACKSLGH